MGCSFNDPVENLSWLKERVTEIENTYGDLLIYQFIQEATYKKSSFHKGETVFIFNNCCPVCNTILQVYNCNGELLGILGPTEDFINPDLIINSRVIWLSSNSECTFTLE